MRESVQRRETPTSHPKKVRGCRACAWILKKSASFGLFSARSPTNSEKAASRVCSGTNICHNSMETRLAQRREGSRCKSQRAV